MGFLQIERVSKNVPSEATLRAAIVTAGGTVTEIDWTSRQATVRWTGQADKGVFTEQIGYSSSYWLLTWDDTVAVSDQGASLFAATQYEIDIIMSSETVDNLKAGGYALYGFKAVQTTVGGGAPLVWFKTPSSGFDELTEVVWSVQYEAYTSTSQIIAGGRINATFARNVVLGDTLNRRATGGDVTRDSGTPPYAIKIANHTETPYTCGVSQSTPGGPKNPMCAFPLYGLHSDVIAPIEKVMLMFASQPVNTGTVYRQSFGPGVLVDLTSANERELKYDMNKSWSWGNYAWAQTVPAGANLQDWLIDLIGAPQQERVASSSLVYG